MYYVVIVHKGIGAKVYKRTECENFAVSNVIECSNRVSLYF